jgi:hypothetical protein
MAPSLHPLLIQNTPCFHYFGLYILGGLSRHVKNVRLFASLLSQANHVILSLQVSSLLVFLPSSILLVSWSWLQAQFSSILGLFESRFAFPHLFHRIIQAIQDEVKHVFHLPFDWIAQDLTDELTWFIFLLLPHWCLRYTRGGRSNVCLKKFMAGD